MFNLNPADAPSVRRLLADPNRLVPLLPFIDAAGFAMAAHQPHARKALRARLGIAGTEPLLLTAAMMRPGAKLASYRCLADALGWLVERPWRLLVAGDGPAEGEVRAAMAPLGERVVLLGRCDEQALKAAYAASDLYVWPAIDEAYGMAFLEAQAAGLAVVAGRSGGVPAVVAEGEAGTLVPPGDAAAFATATGRLLDDAKLRQAMGEAARERVLRHHHLDRATAMIREQLTALMAGAP